jgi:hypothetical protein
MNLDLLQIAYLNRNPEEVLCSRCLAELSQPSQPKILAEVEAASAVVGGKGYQVAAQQVCPRCGRHACDIYKSN